MQVLSTDTDEPRVPLAATGYSGKRSRIGIGSCGGSHRPSGACGTAMGFSLSNSHRAGLSWMYWRIFVRDSSLRTTCSK